MLGDQIVGTVWNCCSQTTADLIYWKLVYVHCFGRCRSTQIFIYVRGQYNGVKINLSKLLMHLYLSTSNVGEDGAHFIFRYWWFLSLCFHLLFSHWFEEEGRKRQKYFYQNTV